MNEDITILKGMYMFGGRFSPVARLYYYQGNFFKPLTLDGREVGRVKRAIRQFVKENKALVEQDRARPGYKTLVELFDEQMAAADAAGGRQ